MARTRFTAKKATGGSAKRVTLTRLPKHHDADPDADPDTDVQMEPAVPPLDLQLCFMCQDGGDIWECNEQGCGRAVCSKCIKIPSNAISKLKADKVKFKCVSCHWKVSRTNKNLPYFAFTTNGKPVLEKFIEVQGIFEVSTNARVHSPPTLLLHFRLRSIVHVAHFAIVYENLAEYYLDQDELRVIDIPFDVGDDQNLRKWEDEVDDIVEGLPQNWNVVVFVTTHSDPDRGDLWLGKDEDGEVCATSVNSWISSILEPFKAVLGGSMLFLLACGSIVRNRESFGHLKQGLASLGVSNALAFDAERVTSLNTVGLLMRITQSVIVHEFDFTEALETALRQSLTLGKHTNVIHFTQHDTTAYIWAHKDFQPWGTTMPLQCPQCGILDPWQKVYIKAPPGYKVECQNKNCGRVSGGNGPYGFEVRRPDDLVLLGSANDVSGWMKVSNCHTV